MDSLQILHVKLAYCEEKIIIVIATLVLVAMVMYSWKNMDYTIRNISHYLSPIHPIFGGYTADTETYTTCIYIVHIMYIAMYLYSSYLNTQHIIHVYVYNRLYYFVMFSVVCIQHVAMRSTCVRKFNGRGLVNFSCRYWNWLATSTYLLQYYV